MRVSNKECGVSIMPEQMELGDMIDRVMLIFGASMMWK